MVQGETIYDETVLNIESLWSGGPFQSSVILSIPHYQSHIDGCFRIYHVELVIHRWKYCPITS